MKSLKLLGLLLFVSFASVGQDMSKEKLKLITAKNATLIGEEGNSVRFKFKETQMILVYDERANRMRIITPVAVEKDLNKKILTTLLQANYDTALDAKYAINDGYVWSTYIHPLKELEEPQVLDALHQVRNLLVTYGTYYTSTNLTFGGGK